MCSCSWAPRSLCSLLFTALSVDSMLCLTWPGTGIWMPPCGKGWITLTNSFLKPNQLFLDGNLYIKPHLCKCHVCHPTGGCHHHIKGKLLLVQQKILQTGKGSLACTELKGRFSLSKESLRRTFIMVLTVLHFIPY